MPKFTYASIIEIENEVIEVFLPDDSESSLKHAHLMDALNEMGIDEWEHYVSSPYPLASGRVGNQHFLKKPLEE